MNIIRPSLPIYIGVNDYPTSFHRPLHGLPPHLVQGLVLSQLTSCAAFVQSTLPWFFLGTKVAVPVYPGLSYHGGVLSNLLGNAILVQWTDPKPVDYVVTT